jgi:hypothetical protein
MKRGDILPTKEHTGNYKNTTGRKYTHPAHLKSQVSAILPTSTLDLD